MVYVDPEELRWQPYVATWMATIGTPFTDETRELLHSMFERYIDPGLNFVRKKCVQAMQQVCVCIHKSRTHIHPVVLSGCSL